MDRSIRLLAICASPRRGNSAYLMEQALGDELPFPCKIDKYYFSGKKIGPCISCHKCVTNGGHCIVKDDYEDLRQRWITADAILYCFPVYAMGLPGQLKCFIDRLGNSFYGYYQVSSMRHMKVIGAVTSGCHFFGGQELAINQIQNHAILLNSLPVSGDGPASYTGAAAWTDNKTERDAFRVLYEAGDRDAIISVTAARSVVRRCVEMAAIVKNGVSVLQEQLEADIRYQPFIRRMTGS